MPEKEPIEDLYLSEEDLKEVTVVTKGKKPWSFRAYNLIFDKLIIQNVVKADKRAARIFLTGESHIDYLGEDAVGLLLGIQNADIKSRVFTEPLFTGTRNGTLRMTRFDPKFVWPCMDVDTLLDLVDDEMERLNLTLEGELLLDDFDFFESMIACMQKHNGEYCVPTIKRDMTLDEHFCNTYFACLLLFNKPRYMDVHVSTYFSNADTHRHFAQMEYRVLNEEEQKKVKVLKDKYGRLPWLTNEELLCVATLFEEE
ncbi:MAG: hypothetical protein FWH35_05630 [Treponema sp.]|nr:hypothetical protein [Treponema sp.]